MQAGEKLLEITVCGNVWWIQAEKKRLGNGKNKGNSAKIGLFW